MAPFPDAGGAWSAAAERFDRTSVSLPVDESALACPARDQNPSYAMSL